MTRSEFIQAYAKRSSIDYAWAMLGFIEISPGWKMVALPCACESDGCPGWGMVGIEYIDHHMQFYAPKEMREAYMKALRDRGGV